MQVGAYGNEYSHTAYKSSAKSASFAGYAEGMSSRKAQLEKQGEFLGLTMITQEGSRTSYGMRAVLPSDYSPEQPIVQVISNVDGKKEIYEVDISKVDPENASQMEMFAFLSYTDKMGLSDGGTFGSFQQAKVYMSNAGESGYAADLSGYEAFLDGKQNWKAGIDRIKEDYLNAGIFDQYRNCQKLLSAFELFGGQRADDEDGTREENLQDMLQARMKEILEKIKKGETEASYQIGAQTFTEKEWDKLLARFDGDEDKLKELLKEEIERKKREQLRQLERQEAGKDQPEAETAKTGIL